MNPPLPVTRASIGEASEPAVGDECPMGKRYVQARAVGKRRRGRAESAADYTAAMGTPAEWVGSIGVSLLLLAFFLNLTGRLAREGRPYAALNTVGGALACASAWMIGFLPFVLLEGTWAVFALVALVRPRRG